MALIKCPECGKEVSSRAISCPNCGCPISNTQSTATATNQPSIAQVRILCKTTSMKVDGTSVKHGSIINIPVHGSREILFKAVGGAVGILGSSLSSTVIAGHKYDLDVHRTLVGKMLYLKEVNSFI